MLRVEPDQRVENRIGEPFFGEMGEPLLEVLTPDMVETFPCLLRVGSQGPLPVANALRHVEDQGMHLGGPSAIELHKAVLKVADGLLPIASPHQNNGTLCMCVYEILEMGKWKLISGDGAAVSYALGPVSVSSAN